MLVNIAAPRSAIPDIESIPLVKSGKDIAAMAKIQAKEILKRYKKNAKNNTSTVVFFGNCPNLMGEGDLLQLLVKQEFIYAKEPVPIVIGTNEPTTLEDHDRKVFHTYAARNESKFYDEALGAYYGTHHRPDVKTQVKKLHTAQAAFRDTMVNYDGIGTSLQEVLVYLPPSRERKFGYRNSNRRENNTSKQRTLCLNQKEVLTLVQSPYYQKVGNMGPFSLETVQSAQKNHIETGTNKEQFLQAVHCVDRINKRLEASVQTEQPALFFETCNLDVLFNREETSIKRTVDITNLFGDVKADIIAVGLMDDSPRAYDLYTKARNAKKTMPENMSFLRFTSQEVSNWNKNWDEICYSNNAQQFQIYYYS